LVLPATQLITTAKVARRRAQLQHAPGLPE
jgi:hypothetical protein